jgi:hypothetical protein|tara:strand:+ start:116 stop:232 length:117 start_codon:yes stop_codon:yes gene_type:complete
MAWLKSIPLKSEMSKLDLTIESDSFTLAKEMQIWDVKR